MDRTVNDIYKICKELYNLHVDMYDLSVNKFQRVIFYNIKYYTDIY